MTDSNKSSLQIPSQLSPRAFYALRIIAPNLDAAQSLYNALLNELDAATQALETLKLLQEAHSIERDKKLRPLENQARQLYAQMIEQLELRLLNPSGLSRKHLADIETVACAFSKVLKTPVPQPTAACEMHTATHTEIPSRTHAEQQAAEREAAKQAHQTKRQQAKPTAKTGNATEIDAQNTHDMLRNMYRKLASTLHPDRARDESERLRKTALMGQVNAANDAKDLLSLLRLQLQAHSPESPTETAYTAGMPSDKLKHINQQLQAQIKALQDKSQLTQRNMQAQWDLPYGKISAKSLQMALRKETQELTSHIACLQSDVLWLTDDAFLKNWLSAQFSQQVIQHANLFD